MKKTAAVVKPIHYVEVDQHFGHVLADGDEYTAMPYGVTCGLCQALPTYQAHRKVIRLETTIESWRRTAKNTQAALIDGLATDPLYALQWSFHSYEAIARGWVANWASGVLNHEQGGYAEVIRLATIEALRGARYPEHSTSPTSNLAAQAKVAAFAELIDGAKLD